MQKANKNITDATTSSVRARLSKSGLSYLGKLLDDVVLDLSQQITDVPEMNITEGPAEIYIYGGKIPTLKGDIFIAILIRNNVAEKYYCYKLLHWFNNVN